MNLTDIYYYCISIAMITGVRIASALNLNIDQNSNGRLCIKFWSSSQFSGKK